MSIQISQATFRIGAEKARDFSDDCEHGDTEEFKIAFRPAFTKPATVRVIVTANNLDVGDTHNAAVVGIAQRVTEEGFVLKARNSDCGRGRAGLNWLAVAEAPQREDRAISLRMGVVQPGHFSPDCLPGDSQGWRVSFGARFNRSPIVLLTASNLNVRNHNAAAVGISQDPTNDGFTLSARNSDCAEGDCAFYYVAFSEEDGRNDLWIDTGELRAQSFSPDCVPGNLFTPGDSKVWDVAFSEAFLTPPVVLVTANDRGMQGIQENNAAVVGMARDVTTHGFTLAARNSDCASGQAGFYWIAIGCAKGCG